MQEVTGLDAHFDSEVEASEGRRRGSSSAEVKWVPADEITVCKQHADSMKVDVAELQRKAEESAAASIADYQANYPKKMFFGYEWDRKKAAKFGFDAIWADDKFTYIKAQNVLALYEINEDGKPSLIQYSFSDGLYRVDKVLFDGYFAIGPKKANRLIFHRSKS